MAYACQQGGNLPTVKTLIEAGANLHQKTKDSIGLTPIHLAAQSGKIEIVRFLVRSGAEVDAKDNLGKTPLKYATSNCDDHQNPVVDFLLSKGAQMIGGDCCTKCLQEMDYLKLC